MSSVNLDVNLYTTSELLDFAGLEADKIEDVTENQIKAGMDAKIIRAEQLNKPNFTQFFHGVRERLLEFHELANVEEEEVEVTKGAWVDMYEPLVDDETKQKYKEQYGQATGNDTTKYLLHINSRDRKVHIDNYNGENVEILDQRGVNINPDHTSGVQTKYKRKNCVLLQDVYLTKKEKRSGETESNFLFTLSTPLKNITKLRVKQVEIPFCWYNFKKDYTCVFKIGPYNAERAGVFAAKDYIYPWDADAASEVRIEEGNYTQNELISEVRKKLKEVDESYDISLNLINGKVTISSTTQFNLYFYLKNIPSPGKLGSEKIPAVHEIAGCPASNYNLGYLLGFRDEILIGEKSYQASSLIDVGGTKSILLEVNDFQQNCPTNNIVTIKRFGDYFERKRSLEDCHPPSLKAANITGCNNNVVGVEDTKQNRRSRISRKMWLSRQELSHFWKKTDTRLKIPSIGNCYCRLQVKKKFEGEKALVVEPKDGLKAFFGPVTLTRLHVSLKDENGFPLDLNGMDWSLVLEAESVFLTAKKQFKTFAEKRTLKKK
tara:strand:+ start:369 stop:2009 length:1641 start_codon:yes stop_codon:yes gene_type:complete